MTLKRKQQILKSCSNIRTAMHLKDKNQGNNPPEGAFIYDKPGAGFVNDKVRFNWEIWLASQAGWIFQVARPAGSPVALLQMF